MRRTLVPAALALALAACVARAPAPQTEPVVPTTAAESGIVRTAPMVLSPEAATRALRAFRTSCPKLLTRSDASGLTQAGDWDALCAEAGTLADAQAPWFFANRFAWVRVGDGKAFATGYYEPELAGSLVPGAGGSVPIYAKPDDLVRCVHADTGKEGRGRVDPATGECLYYFTRAEIDAGALSGRGLEIAYARRPVDLFFLQIQGSGRLALPDGSTLRLGYADQNGRDYVAIGKLMRERGIFAKGEATRDAIVAWILAHPAEGKALMEENPSYIFFRKLDGEGPLGALEVPVTAKASVAADPKFIPLGAPVFLDMVRDEADGLWIAQDTGGAIKGANRVDTFWGHGAEAERIAGGMAADGSALLLLPLAAADRALSRR